MHLAPAWPAFSVMTLCLLLAGGAARAQPQGPACSKAIVVGTGHWEPYAYFDARKQFTGLDVDMTRAIFREAGCVLVEAPMRPTTRNMMLFESGVIDMMMGASLTPERQKLAWFTSGYRNEKVAMFSLAERAARYRALRTFDDFVAGRLTMLAPRVGYYGEHYGRHMAALRDGKRLFQFLDFTQGIRMLAAGRADFMMRDPAGVEHAAAREGIKVQPLPFWLVDAPVHLMLNRATVPEADVQRLDAAIVRLRKRGEFERIRQTYGGG